MTNDTFSKIQIKKPQGKVRKLIIKHNGRDPNQTNAKRDRFLALMKSKYGYTNDKALDELTRLLKQFYTSNRSLGIRHARPGSKLPHFE